MGRKWVDRASSWMADRPPKGDDMPGHVNYLNFSGHQLYLWNDWSYRVVKSSVHAGYVMSQHTDEKSPLKGARLWSRLIFFKFWPPIISLESVKQVTSNFVCWLIQRSTSSRMIDYSVPWQRPLTEVHQILAVGNFFNNGVNAIIRKCCDPSTQCRMRGATFKQELSCRREKALCLCSIIHYVQHCYGTVRFIIYNTNVSERKSGERVFFNLAPAGFQLGTCSTASHHAIIRPWNQH